MFWATILVFSLSTERIYLYPCCRCPCPSTTQVILDIVRCDGRLGEAVWLGGAGWSIIGGPGNKLLKTHRSDLREPVSGADYRRPGGGAEPGAWPSSARRLPRRFKEPGRTEADQRVRYSPHPQSTELKFFDGVPTVKPIKTIPNTSPMAGWKMLATMERFDSVDSMTAPNPIVFLVDVDDTLLNNDHIQGDLKRHIDREFGAEYQYRLLGESGRSLQRAGVSGLSGRPPALPGRETPIEPHLVTVASFLVDYPFADRLYPGITRRAGAVSRDGGKL